MKKIWLFSLFTMSLLLGFAQGAKPAKAIHRVVTKKEFLEQMKTGKPYIIDVRTPEEHKAGNIKGAMNIDFFSTDFDKKLAEIPKDKKVLIYCQSGGRSAKTLEKMKKMGFVEVYELQGGYKGW